MRKSLLIVAVLSVLSSLTVAALAQTAPPAPPSGPVGVRADYVRPVPCILPTLKIISAQMVPMLAARLSLSEADKAKVLDLLTKSDNDIKPKIENQVKAAQDYTTLLANPKASQAELVAAADKAMKAESEVLMVRIQALFTLKALLNEEQNKQLAEYLDQFAKPWRERPGSIPLPPVAPPATPAK